MESGPQYETDEMPEEPLLLKWKPGKREAIAALRKEKLSKFLTSVPGTGEVYSIVSNGSFDYWQFVPRMLELKTTPMLEFYGSTWTMNRANALELLALYDAGRIQKIALFSGLYFKRRETAVYTTISEGLIDRKQRFLCFENHTKIILARFADAYFVLSGSANFTANPRQEQNDLVNDQGLFEFHRDWMEKLLRKCGQP